jgi:hypothetical protein
MLRTNRRARKLKGGEFCAILLTFLDIFSRLLGYVTPIWGLMKRPWIPPPEQSAR